LRSTTSCHSPDVAPRQNTRTVAGSTFGTRFASRPIFSTTPVEIDRSAHVDRLGDEAEAQSRPRIASTHACGWRIVISPMIPQDFPSLLRFSMGNLLVLFTIERLSYDQALHASSHTCKLLIAKEMVGASRFEPPSWSRTMNTNSINALSSVAYGMTSLISPLGLFRPEMSWRDRSFSRCFLLFGPFEARLWKAGKLQVTLFQLV
jgi:hypothetical protein